MNLSLKDILVIDIETVAVTADFNSLSESLQQQWIRKAGFLKNEEELPHQELYIKRAGIYAEFGKVITVAVGIFYEKRNGKHGLRVKSFADHNEKKLLLSFKEFLEKKIDQEKVRFCAHNGKEFDYPYLCRRMIVNDISLPKSLNLTGKKPWEVPHLDTMEMWKFGDRKSYTSLDLLTSLFDIKSSKAEMDGSMVNDVYYNSEGGLEKIATYCRGDVVATSQVFLKLNSLPLIEKTDITIVAD